MGFKIRAIVSKRKNICLILLLLVKLLAEAKSNQDVVFTVEGWYRKKTLSENRVTSGRVFYNKNGLNIIFGSIMRKGNISDTDPMVICRIKS